MIENRKLTFTVETMATAFKRSLIEHMGPIEDKPLIERIAWSEALLELALELKLATVQNREELD